MSITETQADKTVSKPKHWWSWLTKYITAKELYAGIKVDKELPFVLYYLDRWELVATILRLIYLTLGVVAIFFSLLAAVQIGSIQDAYAKIFAFIAAVSIAFMSGFNLTDKSNNVRAAWRELNAGVMKYNTGDINDIDLIEIYREQKKKIGDVIFSKGS
jgi:hypothetical protein